MRKVITNLGAISYFLLLTLALLFYKERTVFIDIAFHLFYILKDGDLAIQNNRFGSVVTQIFPLVASKVGFSLESIMKLYSASFIIYYFLVFLLISKVLKKPKFALAMLLFSTLMINDTFYWIQSEFPQGLAFLILSFSVWATMKSDSVSAKKWYLPISVVLLLTLVFFHPLLLFPFSFLLAYFYLQGELPKEHLISLGVSYFSLYFIKSIFFKTKYDAQAMGGIKNFINHFPNYFSLKSFQDFYRFLWQDYYFLLLGLLALTIYYFREKKILRLGLVWVFCFFYVLLVNVSYPNGTEQFYIENLYLPLSIFIGFPLAFDLLPRLNVKQLYLLLALVLMIRIAHIGLSHQAYSDRLVWLRETINQVGDTKVMIPETEEMKEKLVMTWGTSYEFWLLSTIENGKTSSIIIDDDVEGKKWALPENKKFLTKWGAFSYSELPSQYFIFKDTSFYKIRNLGE